MNEEATEVTLSVIQVLDHLGIPYLIVGSLASSFYGVARSTIDTDLVADIDLEHVEQLELGLQDEFYIAKEDIREALSRRSSFNVIHYSSVFKVDLFVPKPRRFDQIQFANRRLVEVAVNPSRSAYVASAEDTVLAKLEWYRLGNEVSDRQWQDIVGIVRMQGEALSLSYLREMAHSLKVDDLLEQALTPSD